MKKSFPQAVAGAALLRWFLLALTVLAATPALARNEALPEHVTVPPGWQAQIVRVHDNEIVSIMAPGDMQTAAQLIHYRFPLPMIDSDLEKTTSDVVDGLGLGVVSQTTEAAPPAIPGVTYRDLLIQDRNDQVFRLLAVGHEQGPHQNLYILIATGDDFSRLGGADFLLSHLSRFGSLSALREDAELRDRVIGQSDPNHPDALDFTLVLQAFEGMTGYRMSGQEVRAFRRQIQPPRKARRGDRSITVTRGRLAYEGHRANRIGPMPLAWQVEATVD